MSDDKPSSDKPPANPLQQAGDRIRETIKWLIASLAAIGAALIAGTQLSSIGKVEGAGRLFAAGVGIVLGLGGVATAIWFAVQVLAPEKVTLGLPEHGLR